MKNGENGRVGQNGEDGKQGEAGTDGKSGEKGQQGSSGSDGDSGSTGASGAGGISGSGGKNGGNGTAGKDAITESSINSALPAMTFTDWQISATGLKGTISITDNGGFLAAIGELEDYQTQYPGSITITNIDTGKKIACCSFQRRNGQRR